MDKKKDEVEHGIKVIVSEPVINKKCCLLGEQAVLKTFQSPLSTSEVAVTTFSHTSFLLI